MRNKLKCTPKSFYQFVNSKRRSCCSLSLLKFGYSISTEDIGISNIFADLKEVLTFLYYLSTTSQMWLLTPKY